MALGAGSVACASEDKEKEEKIFVGAAEVCGDVFAGPLAKMVEKVTRDTVFYAKSPKGQGFGVVG
ncbi:hypothetical protein ACWD04_05435 [Streptomyces sp. NPDC002911]